MMIAGRASILFLIYTYQIFLGTPPVVVAIQTVALAIAGACITITALRTRNAIFPVSFWIFFLTFLSFLFLELIIGMEQGRTPVSIMVRFLMTFIATLSLPLFAYAAPKIGLISSRTLITHIISATAIYCSIKLLITLAFLIWDFPPAILALVFQSIFNTTPTFDTIVFGILRFMAPTDFTTPVLLFYCLFYMKGVQRVLLSLLFIVSIFTTYSRYIWVEALFVVAMVAFRMSRGQLFAAMAAMLLAFPLANTLPSIPLIESRFSSSAANSSDSIRVKQYEALTADLGENLLFGHGLASFSFKVIRDTGTPYSYELQWTAFAYQLGLVGLVFLLGMALFNCGPLLGSVTMESIPILLVYCFSLLSGFANPSLVGRSAGAGFAFILSLGLVVREKFDLQHNRSPRAPAINTM